MKNLIKKILKENNEEKFFNFLIKKYGKDFFMRVNPNELKRLQDTGYSRNQNTKKVDLLSISPEELSKIKKIILSDELHDIEDKIEEYVVKYGETPKLAQEKFLKDVISIFPNKGAESIKNEIYEKFLKKLSEFSGQEIKKGRTSPERSGILMKLSKFIEEPSDVPKSRSEFLKTLNAPKGHYSTTFSRLLRNNLIKSVKKDGKWVYELGDNFDKFIQGTKPEITDDVESLFEDFISEHGNNTKIFYDKFRNLFYKDSDWRKFYTSFRKYIVSRRYV